MKKTLPALITAFIAWLGVVQPVYASCTINGKEIPCDQFWNSYGLFFTAFTGGAMIIAAGIFMFWLWMLIDCLRQEMPNKRWWVLGFFFVGGPIALVYYVLVKKKVQQTPEEHGPKPITI
jgi:uncharacterized membrane protein YedE/YeeE